MRARNEGMIKQIPLIITDKNGKIIQSNEAAHSISAALSFGTNIESIFDADALEVYKCALSGVRDSFSVKSPILDGYELIFDLTKERSDGIRTVHLRKPAERADVTVSYDDLRDAFSDAVSGHEISKRRVSELYETLAPSGAVLGSVKHIEVYSLRDILDPFYEHILPRLLSVYGDVISNEIGVTDDSIIYAEPYGLCLSLSAMLTSASATSEDGGASLTVTDRGDTITFQVASVTDRRMSDDKLAIFGSHYVDLLYAQTLARASGYGFDTVIERHTGRVTLTLSVKCHDYYPAYLKARPSTAKSAAVMASLFPFAALN